MGFFTPRLSENGYIVFNNPLFLSIKPQTSFGTSYAGLQYTTDTNDNAFLQSYATGGIKNKVNRTLYTLIMYHIPIQRSSSASGNPSWIYFQVRRHNSTTSEYTTYRYLGTQLFIGTTNVIYMTGSAYIPIPPLGYMALFIGTDKGTANSSTSGRVEIQPIGLGGYGS